MLKINGMLYLAKISSGALSCFQQGLTFVLIIIIVSLSTLGKGHIWSITFRFDGSSTSEIPV